MISPVMVLLIHSDHQKSLMTLAYGGIYIPLMSGSDIENSH